MTLANTTTSLAENTSTSNAIKVAYIVISDDALSNNTISLGGADAAAFEVLDSALYLKAGTALDFEIQNSYSLTVSVLDATIDGSSPVTTSYSLAISDLNEAPTEVTLANTTTSLAENTSTSNAIKVTDIVISDDALGSNTISLLGSDAAAFEVIGTALYLKADTAINYEIQNSYNLTVSVNDATIVSSSPVTTSYSLAISDLNEAPAAVTVVNTTTSLAENTSTSSAIKVADIAISDDALGNNTISLLGSDADAFEVIGTALFLKADTTLNYETQNSYSLTVSVSDATLDGSIPVTTGYSLTISDQNEAPAAVTLANTTTSLPENISPSGAIKVADIAISDDALGSNTISLGGDDTAAFEVIGTALYLKADTTLNYETKNSYSLTVSVLDATINGSSPVSTIYSLAISDLNDAPTAVTLANTTTSLPENINTAGRIKVADIAISDEDLDTSTISLLGADAAGFEVIGKALFLKSGTTLNYQAKTAYEVTVSVKDATIVGSSPVTTTYNLAVTPAVSLSVAPITVSESSLYAVVAVSISEPISSALSFTPVLVSGSASIGSDTGSSLEYFNGSAWVTSTSGVTIAAGSSSVLLRVAITNNSTFEGVKSFQITTGPIAGAAAALLNVAAAAGTVSIADDGSSAQVFDLGTNSSTPIIRSADSDIPAIALTSIVVSEASPYAVLQANLSNPSNLLVSFTPSLLSGSAGISIDTGSSLELLDGTNWVSAASGVSFAAGVTSRLVRVAIVNDSLYEISESFTINTGAITGSVVNPAGVSGTVTIRDNGSSANTFTATNNSPIPSAGLADNDTPPLPALTAAVLNNGNEAGPVATRFRISRSGDTNGTLDATYRFTGSAITGFDYSNPDAFDSVTGLGTLTFAAGQSSVDLSVATIDDSVVDGNRSLALNLLASTTYNLAAATAPATIVDNDVAAPVVPTFSISSASVVETDAGTNPTINLLVNLTSASSSSVSVYVRTLAATSGTTASSGSDYISITSKLLTFSPGSTGQLLPIELLGDNLVENTESFLVELFNASGAYLPAAAATVEIIDNDSSKYLNIDNSAATTPQTFSGGQFDDILIGGSGADTINGDPAGLAGGADAITGGPGADILTGGPGADRFRYPSFSHSTLNSTDRIRDLTLTGSDQDRIALATLPTALWNAGVVVASSPTTASSATKAYLDKDVTTTGNQALAAGESVLFAYDSTPGNSRTRQWFVAVNDSSAGFSSSSDLLINVTGISFNYATGSITPSLLFSTL